MSDVSQGEGWWQASDGKWYAPELHPDYVAPAADVAGAAPEPAMAAPGAQDPTAPVPAQPPAGEPTAPVATGGEPTIAAPAFGPPPGVPPIAAGGAPPIPPAGGGGGKGRLIAAIIVVVALIGGGIAFALTRGDDKKASDQTESSSSTDSTDTTSSDSTSTDATDTVSSSSVLSTSELVAKAKKALLVPTDIDRSFSKAATPSARGPLPCSSKRVSDLAKTAGHETTELDKDTNDVFILEDIYVYSSEADAKTVFKGIKAGLNCGTGTVETSDGSTNEVTFDGPPESITIKADVDDSFGVRGEITSSTSGNLHGAQASTTTTAPATTDTLATESSSSGPLAYLNAHVVRIGQVVLSFQYVYTPDADTSGLDAPSSITSTGVDKFLE